VTRGGERTNDGDGIEAKKRRARVAGPRAAYIPDPASSNLEKASARYGVHAAAQPNMRSRLRTREDGPGKGGTRAFRAQSGRTWRRNHVLVDNYEVTSGVASGGPGGRDAR